MYMYVYICKYIWNGPSPQAMHISPDGPLGPGPARPRGSHKGTAHKGQGGVRLKQNSKSETTYSGSDIFHSDPLVVFKTLP